MLIGLNSRKLDSATRSHYQWLGGKAGRQERRPAKTEPLSVVDRKCARRIQLDPTDAVIPGGCRRVSFARADDLAVRAGQGEIGRPVCCDELAIARIARRVDFDRGDPSLSTLLSQVALAGQHGLAVAAFEVEHELRATALEIKMNWHKFLELIA
jgi:hypothetical protein